MFRNILVAYDGSDASKVALDQAVEITRLSQAELHLLGIVRTTGISALAQATGTADVWGMERRQIETALESVSGDLADQGLKIVTGVREGDPAEEIVLSAIGLGADLVVLGHSDKGIFARWFEGSVGARILRELPCSLMIASR